MPKATYRFGVRRQSPPRRTLPAHSKFVCLALLLTLGGAGAGEEKLVRFSSPDLVPPVLLAAPINATWAANHAEYWQRIGFCGFLFEGIFDTLDDPRWSEAESAPEAFGHPLLEEIRLAQTRLRESGIEKNFLRLTFSPGNACLASPNLREQAIRLISRAGVFCRRAGLRGLALDTSPGDPAYWKQWEGYADGTTDISALPKVAHDFAKSILRAFIRACPEGEILLVATDTQETGPLWFNLLDGLIASAGAADTVPIELLAAAPPARDSEEELKMRRDTLQRTLGLCLGKEAWSIWKRQGGVDLGLTPLGFIKGIAPAEFASPETFRRHLTAAKLLSHRYAWIDAPVGGWWYVSAEEAGQYATLRQNGRAAVQETVVVSDAVWEFAKGRRSDFPYTVRQPLDGFQRIGTLPGYETPPTWGWVLRNGNEAALAAWNPRAIFASKEHGGRGDVYVLENGAAPCWVTPLESGVRQPLTPKDRLEVPIPDGPVLLEGLPLSEWAISAALSIESEAPLTPGGAPATLELGYTQASPLAMDAQIECTVPNDPFANTRNFQVSLKDGESIRLHHRVQGNWRLGATQTFQLSLIIPGGAVVHREAAFPVWPEMKGAYWCGAPLVGAPSVQDFDGDGRYEIAFCDADGGVTGLRANGELLWQRVSTIPFEVGPAALQERDGALVAVCDGTGQLRCLDGEGREVFMVSLGGGHSPQALLSAQLGDAVWLVAGMPDGRVVAVEPRSGRLWEHILKGPLLEVCVAEGAVAALVQEDVPVLRMLDGRGEIQWRTELPPMTVTRPLLAILSGNPSTIVASTLPGELLQFEISTGSPLRKISLGGPVAVQCVAASGLDLLAGTECGLYCIGADGALRWDMGGWGVPSVASRRVGGVSMTVAATERGGWMGVNSEGALQWEENRALGPILGVPCVGDIDADGRIECVYGSADRTVRIIGLDLVSAPPPRVIRGSRRPPGPP